jgi:hypothetical protein
MPKNLNAASSANRLFNLRDRNIALSQPPEEIIESLSGTNNLYKNHRDEASITPANKERESSLTGN